MVRPVPIPNTAVKHSLADGSGCIASARVGCRQFLLERPEKIASPAFLLPAINRLQAAPAPERRFPRRRLPRADKLPGGTSPQNSSDHQSESSGSDPESAHCGTDPVGDTFDTSPGPRSWPRAVSFRRSVRSSPLPVSANRKAVSEHSKPALS